MSTDGSAHDLNWVVSRTCEGGACVAVARKGDSVMIRRINPEGPITQFTMEEWLHFIAGAKRGDFDDVVVT
jgi:hypothetical protein